MALKQTPSQTVGPYFAYGLSAPQYGYPHTAIANGVLVGDDTEGERIRIVGQVIDGEGRPVSDALIEIWQANAHGRYNHPADARKDNYDPKFTGFGRLGTGSDPQHRFIFDTVKPGAIGDGQAPHLNVIVTMRGLLSHAFTRIYFPEDAEAIATDSVLAAVPADRRQTLVARREENAVGRVYRFDIHMQGDKETVFFDM